MNGAAVNSQQEQALHQQHNDSSSLHSPGYLQTNYPCQEKKYQHQYSKAMNYKLLPDSQYIASYSSETRNRLSNSVDIQDGRINPTRILREPMELPVPKFEIDENSVGVFKYKKFESSSVQESNDLDLDTRINLLIKSKALSGMHPIFSDLNESDESSTDSEETYCGSSKLKPLKRDKISLSENHAIHQESFDDPEKPLSRPPSPFLSRATYLFWFNKAIELKQQAKAQEQALLEKATKKLCQGNFSSGTKSKTEDFKHNNNILKSLLSEVSKELKECIKQEFIKEIFENTVLNSLEDWWVKERKLEEDNFSKDLSNARSTINDNMQSNGNEPANAQANINSKTSLGQRLSKSKVPFATCLSKNQKSKEKHNILRKKVPTSIESNKNLIIKQSDTYVSEELAAKNESVLCKESDNLRNKSLKGNLMDTTSSCFKEKNLKLKKIKTNKSINNDQTTSDITNSNNEVFVEKSNGNLWQDEKNVLQVPINTEESNMHSLSPEIECLPVSEKLAVNPSNENILMELDQEKSSKSCVIELNNALDPLDCLEEKGIPLKDVTENKNENGNRQQDLS